jgi:hypothetical protein
MTQWRMMSKKGKKIMMVFLPYFLRKKPVKKLAMKLMKLMI